jgi:hypothetical protein
MTAPMAAPIRKSDAHRPEHIGSAKRSGLRTSGKSGEQAFDGVALAISSASSRGNDTAAARGIDPMKFRWAMFGRKNKEIAWKMIAAEAAGLT